VLRPEVCRVCGCRQENVSNEYRGCEKLECSSIGVDEG
jgi:hypothetical protein